MRSLGGLSGAYHMFYYFPGQETAAQAATRRNNTLVRVDVRDRQDLTRDLFPRAR